MSADDPVLRDLIPLAEPNLGQREAEYLADCIQSNFVSSVGPYVPRFEAAVADACGAAGTVAVSSGTAGLHLALLCMGVGQGDLVVLPSFTFIASANAIAHCGASPWLFDVDRQSWTLDLDVLAGALRTETERQGNRLVHRPSGRRVAALMPVHTLGLPADMDGINEIAFRYKLPVVADAAAALGARYRGRSIGGLAEASVFSFNGNKTVTSGGGGAIVSMDESLLAKARHLSSQARVGADYLHDAVGYNYRMTNVEAAVGLAQLERLDAFVEIKKRIRTTYDEAFSRMRGIGKFPRPTWADSACWLSGLTVATDSPISADRLRETLRTRGISAGTFWRPVHQQPPYATCPSTRQDVTNTLWEEIVVLPSSTSLDRIQQERVIEVVKQAVAQATI